MRVKLDTESDALYFRLDESAIVESEELQAGVILDFNARGQVVGVELLDVSKRASQEQLHTMQFETV
jgi:uncharacterized protein YuzE